MPEISEYLKQKIAQVRLARFVGEAVCGLGVAVSIAGLYLTFLFLTVTGFTFLLAGLFLSVHYEMQRLEYLQTLENFLHPER